MTGSGRRVAGSQRVRPASECFAKAWVSRAEEETSRRGPSTDESGSNAHARRSIDPNAQWSRKWDGRWRIVVFDVPIGNDRRRQQLRRRLREQWFGCLQGSVWITPDPFNQPDLIGAAKRRVNRCSLSKRNSSSEGRRKSSNAHGISGESIPGTSSIWMLLERKPEGRIKNRAAGRTLSRWAEEEWLAWLEAVRCDPLLPHSLLPSNYLGEEAWHRRIQALRAASDQRRADFSPVSWDERASP